MRKWVLSLVCSFGLLGGATSALAGAYGGTAQPEEMPQAPPAGAAVAQATAPDYAAVGPYIGIGGLYAIELFDHTCGCDYDNSGGFNVRAGYRVHPNIAVEALFEDYVEFERDDHYSVTTRDGHRSAWSTTA